MTSRLTMAEPSSSKIPLDASTFDSCNTDIQAAALKATKLSVALPSDVAFRRSVSGEFAEKLDRCADKSLQLLNSLIELVEGGSGKGKGKLREREDVLDGFERDVVDVLDRLFEQAVSKANHFVDLETS